MCYFNVKLTYMTVAQLKAEIHEHLDLVDERMLKIIRSMLQTDIKN